MTRARKVGATVAGVAAVAALGVAVTPAAQGGAIPALAKRALNADRVDGLSASAKPKPGKLVALDKKGLLPASVVPAGLVSGRTYTGAVGITALAAGAPNVADSTLSSWMGGTISFPAPLKAALDVADMGVQGGGVELPDCAGTFEQPTAPAGKLCVYPGRTVNEASNVFFDDAEVANIATNGEGALEAYARPIGNGRYGVRVDAMAAAAGEAKFYATWAYTAP